MIVRRIDDLIAGIASPVANERLQFARQIVEGKGIDPTTAKDRVGAMSDQEVQSLAGQISAMPAGGTSTGAAVLILILIAAAVWWFWQR